MVKIKVARASKKTGLIIPPRQLNKQIDKRIVHHAEKKYYDVLQNSTVTGSYDNPHYAVLNNFAQGDSDITRDGDTARMKSLHFRALVTAANNAACAGRLLIVQYYAGNRDLASASTITYDLDDVLEGGNAVQSVYDHYRHDLKPRFKVLYDRRIDTRQFGGASTGGTLFIDKKIPLRNAEVQFVSSLQRMSKNCIFLLWTSDRTDASGNEPLIEYNSRLYYSDV